jgi:hypothetical protein
MMFQTGICAQTPGKDPGQDWFYTTGTFGFQNPQTDLLEFLIYSLPHGTGIIVYDGFPDRYIDSLSDAPAGFLKERPSCA